MFQRWSSSSFDAPYNGSPRYPMTPTVALTMTQLMFLERRARTISPALPSTENIDAAGPPAEDVIKSAGVVGTYRPRRRIESLRRTIVDTLRL
ncbi:hypothetical protein QE152_g23434 [Popillia japonica]|uniref:Uncharacterized protein n=1 Tax=Popillia japonica TaxID=7064 RepID=A0AAW1KHI6_POPJA